MNHERDTMGLSTGLELVRERLMDAVRADRARARRRHRTRFTGLVLAATLIGGTAVAAASGMLPPSLFSPAPDAVQDLFGDLEGAGGPSVDASRAVVIGSIDERTTYAAPADGGGFCLYFAPAMRSGPTGTRCVRDILGPSDIILSPEFGGDVGFVFGRVGNDTATEVKISWPADRGSTTTRIARDGFFLASIPDRVMEDLTEGGSYDPRRMDGLLAMAFDPQGSVVARSTSPVATSVFEVGGDGGSGPSSIPIP
jgi:hypothetical protein